VSDDEELEEPVDPDLENTMRLGLQEIANEAPRGKNVWDTTASMIAIEVDQVAREDPTIQLPPVPPRTTEQPATAGAPPSSDGDTSSQRLVVIALVVAAVLAIAIVAVVLATRG
jgi:hypothetical protein